MAANESTPLFNEETVISRIIIQPVEKPKGMVVRNERGNYLGQRISEV